MITGEERLRFARYLTIDADSNEQLVKQIETLGGHEPLIKKKRAEILACRVVAQMLISGEMQTIK